MKKLLLSIAFALFLCSCSNENESLENQDVQQEEQQITSTLLVDYQIPEQDLYYLQKLGFAGSSAQVFENLDPSSNEVYISYLLEGDIEFKADELTSYLPEEALEKGGGLTSQYRTTLIADPDTYTVFYEPDGSLTSQAVDLAIQNYNNLNLGISFERIGTGNTFIERRRRQIGWYYSNSDIAIKSVDLDSGDGGGGSAGFPSRQQIANRTYQNMPYQDVKIDPDTEDDGLDVLEHVITHEMGHCIGLRHTDWFDRQCISTPGNEGQTQYGAVHIPGTPTTVNIDINSIMMACYNSTTVNNVTFGEFTNFDIIALQELW